MKKTKKTKKTIAKAAAVLFTIILILTIAGCSGYGQTAVTMSTSIESSTVETTLLEIPATETVQEERIPENFELLYISKVISPQELGSIPWFDTIKSGIEKCALDYGFKVTVTGPPKADGAIQAQIVLDNIGKNFDAIAVCPIDGGIIDSAFERANKGGVMTFSNEGYGLKNVTFDIEAMSNEAFGEALMQSALKYTAGQGSYLVSVGFLNSVPQNQWADAEIALQKKSAPGLANILGYAKNSDRFEDSEDPKIASERLTEYIDNNKGLNLIIGNSPSTGIAAQETIAKKKLAGKLFYVGTGLPVAIGEGIAKGILQEGFFWDPYLIGYAIGYVAFKSWMGTEFKDGDPVLQPDGTALEGYESLKIGVNAAGGTAIYGNGVVSINKDNLESWNQRFLDYGWPQ